MSEKTKIFDAGNRGVKKLTSESFDKVFVSGNTLSLNRSSDEIFKSAFGSDEINFFPKSLTDEPCSRTARTP